jgi:uncharacterized protein (TIGR00730 family)
MKRVGVFCGSNCGTDAAYVRAARELGALLVQRRLGLVYGGGNVGLMGALRMPSGGRRRSHRCDPRHPGSAELAHRGCSELRVVATMHERKALMADLARPSSPCRAALNTDEFCEVLTWAQLRFHRRAVC